MARLMWRRTRRTVWLALEDDRTHPEAELVATYLRVGAAAIANYRHRGDVDQHFALLDVERVLAIAQGIDDQRRANREPAPKAPKAQQALLSLPD